MSRDLTIGDIVDEQVHVVANVPAIIASGQQQSELMGRPDRLVFQVWVTNITGSCTLGATYWGSNTGKRFSVQVALLSGVNLTANTPFDVIVDTGTEGLAAYGRLEITLSATSNMSAWVNVSVCGRSA